MAKTKIGLSVFVTIGLLVSLLAASAIPALAAGKGEPVRGNDVIPYVIVHPARGGDPGPPPGKGPGGGGGDDGDHSSHYVLLPGTWADGNITYVVEDPGIDGAVTAIQASFQAWQNASGIDFTFGGTDSVTANVEASGPNDSNTVSWALLTGSWTNALAVTILWIDDVDQDDFWDSGENIVEADILVNSKYDWRIAENAGKGGRWFDIQNVVTHEAGHVVGLGDQDQWSEETMYYAAAPKETKKRTLMGGDTAGATFLWGS